MPNNAWKRCLPSVSESRNFLSYLADRESEQATAELLAFPGFLEDLRRAEAAISSGKLTPVEELRQKP